MKSKLSMIFELLLTPQALLGYLTWKKFSLASYKIINRAKNAGVKPKTIIDVGANLGQFTVAASQLFPNVLIYSIEPDENIAKILQKNIDRSIVQEVIISAIGNHTGEAVFNINSDSQVSSLLDLGKERIEFFPKTKKVTDVKVPINTLDNLFANTKLTHPILLKIDVQGYEEQVLLGANLFLKKVKWVLVEVAFSNLYVGESDFLSINTLMEKHGFKFIRPLNFHLSPNTNEIIEMDALFEYVEK